ncbi:MAG: GFA family protein [Hyphomicrobiales bacterium]|nr:GFA family protein [Hyphomicrobiales bacterium]
MSSGSRLTGGCQCGAVRYALARPPLRACICHCRMCQKASGQPFMAFATLRQEDLQWTRGAPELFRSSTLAERGFCRNCGTPLMFKFEGDEINVTIGSLDTPSAFAPAVQYGIESALTWCATLGDLPGVSTEADFGPELMARFASYQAPDRD